MRKLLKIVITVLLLSVLYIPESKAALTESATVKQVGTSGGIPAVEVALQNASSVGTYTIVIRNAATNEVLTQSLLASKAVTFAVTNFTVSGTYQYVIQVNGIDLLTGGVNLISVKRNPYFKAHQDGTNLKINIANGTDYVGERIYLKSGDYSTSFELTKAEMEVNLKNVKGTTNSIQFSGERGTIVTLELTKTNTTTDNPSGGTTPGTSTPTDPGNNTGNNPNTTPSGNPSGTPDNSSGGSSSGGNTSTTPIKKTSTVKLTLNKSSYKDTDTMTSKVVVYSPDNAGKSVTVRLGLDIINEVVLVRLDKNGNGSTEFKTSIPSPSSKRAIVNLFSLQGDLLASDEKTYSVTLTDGGVGTYNPGNGSTGGSGNSNGNGSGSTNGKGSTAGSNGSGTSESGGSSSGTDDPYVEYLNVNLASLEDKKAQIVWKGAKNLSRYTTILEVTNYTTKESRKYTVFIPDGDGTVVVNLSYDGPGIYIWDLKSNNKTVAKSTYATPLGISNIEAVSQDGLPVIPILTPEEVQYAQLDSELIGDVSAYYAGELVEVVADDVTNTPIENGQVDSKEKSSKNILTISIVVVLILIIAVAIVIILKKRRPVYEEDETAMLTKAEGMED